MNQNTINQNGPENKGKEQNIVLAIGIIFIIGSIFILSKLFG